MVQKEVVGAHCVLWNAQVGMKFTLYEISANSAFVCASIDASSMFIEAAANVNGGASESRVCINFTRHKFHTKLSSSFFGR